jgi:hypothetical protein
LDSENDGSTKAQLILQHMTEAFVITAMSVCAGLGLAKIGVNELNKLYGGEYLKFDLLNEPSFAIFILIITLLISIFAGFYPAFILARYKPVLALRSQTFSGKTRGFSLRKSLVVLQFAGAQILILVTLILINQISHFKERPIGFDPETILLLPHLRGNDKMQHARLEKELEKVPGIISHTISYGLPEGGEPVEFADRAESAHKKTAFVNYVDQSFLKVFSLQVAAGQNFADNQSQKSSEVLVNESLTKVLGFTNAKEAIGSIFFLEERQVKIRGVIQDFYTQALSNAVDPVILRYDTSRISGIAMNISTSNISEVISGIETAWKNVYPNIYASTSLWMRSSAGDMVFSTQFLLLWYRFCDRYFYRLSWYVWIDFVYGCSTHEGDWYSQSVRCYHKKIFLSCLLANLVC